TANGTFSPAEAASVYSRAVDVSTASSLLAADLRGLGTSGAVAITPIGIMDKIQAVSANFPDLRTLFQSISLCDCELCNAVDSPAAYLVDVLQYISQRTVVDTTQTTVVKSQDAQAVLFTRRPDLGDIDLSCANTNTTLPIIDVACELLEEAVSPQKGIAY